jgi:hypothetical protein
VTYLTKLITAATIALGAMATTATAQSIQIDDTWAGGELQWAQNGRTKIRWRPVILEGELHICGAYASIGGPKYRRLSHAVMEQTSVKLDGSVIIRATTHFSLVNTRHYQSDFVGEAAACRATGIQATSDVFNRVELDVKTGRVQTR